MDNEKNTEKLAGYIIKLACLAIVVALCWYFKNVLIYIVAALVVTLLGRPLMKVMRKVKIKGKSAPDWLLAVLSILIIIALIILLISQIIPLVSSIIRDASAITESSYFESNPIDKINEWLIGVFPGLDRNFDIATLVMDNRIETVVHRWLYDNLVPRLAECTDGCCKRWDHACRIENRIKPDLPSMPPRQPADEAFVP